jgi:NAD(P)H-hydrate epimerase
MAVKCVILGDPSAYRGDARVNFEIATRLPILIELAEPGLDSSGLKQMISFVDDRPAEWIVDAILGTGAQGAPRSPAAEVIQLANQVEVRRLAVDLPSGLDGETGELHEPTFRADITCTFVAAKTGFQRAEAADWLGVVKVVEIGITSHILNQVLGRA